MRPRDATAFAQLIKSTTGKPVHIQPTITKPRTHVLFVVETDRSQTPLTTVRAARKYLKEHKP